MVRDLLYERELRQHGGEELRELPVEYGSCLVPIDEWVAYARQLRLCGDFSRVHAWPHSGHDIPDDTDARLVVLGIERPYGRGGASAAGETGAGDFGVAWHHPCQGSGIRRFCWAVSATA